MFRSSRPPAALVYFSFISDCATRERQRYRTPFLADRTQYGRVYATGLRPSVVVVVVVCTECIVAKRCVLEQKSLSTAYRKSYMRNRLVPWPLFGGCSRSCVIATSISPKLLELETSNLVRDFVWEMPSWQTNNFQTSSSVTLYIVAKRYVLEQKLLLRACRKSYMRNRLAPKWMTLTFV